MNRKITSKREQIIQAAFEAVCSRGYYETRLDDIARRARVAKGTVYLYFQDKPDLYVGIIRWLISQAVTIVMETDRQPLNARAKLTMIYQIWTEKLRSYPGALDLIFPEISRKHCHLGQRFRESILPELHRLIDAVARIIKQGIKEHAFRPVEAELAALNFLNAFRSGLLLTSRYLQMKSAPEQALDLFFYGITLPAKGGK
ncbi:MAG: TetR/AcrR family transcriptional regulator [candidate division WOR-3 bacterium]|jgi:TetR/AcrR family fatty acid metabolism transcriptional regulator